MDSDRITAVVTQYVQAWNEPDAAARDVLLRGCWADDGSYVDPTVELKGTDALSRHIGDAHARRPGARIDLVSGVDVHHNVLRFLWRLVRRDGTCGEVSVDFGEIDPAGQLTRIVGFFGRTPAAETHSYELFRD